MKGGTENDESKALKLEVCFFFYIGKLLLEPGEFFV